MFWWFERNGRHARVEVLEVKTGLYELRLIQADGTEQVETFDDARALADRQYEINQALRDQGWSGPHGWVM